MFAAILTTFFFSLSAVCGHRSSKLIGGTEANFWRIGVAACFLAIWSFGFGIGLRGAGLSMFLISGAVGIGLGDVAYFQALPRLGARLSVLVVQCLTAPFGALIEWLWLGTPMTLGQIAAGLTILVGVGIALAPGDHLKLTRRGLIVGSIAGALAGLGQAGGAVLSRKAYAIMDAHGEHIDGLNAAFQRVLSGWLIAGIFLLLVKRRERKFELLAAEPQRRRRAWFWIIANGLSGLTLGVACMQWALEKTQAGVVLSIIATAPIVVIPLAYLIEGEKPSVRSLIGGVIAVGGVIALTQAK